MLLKLRSRDPRTAMFTAARMRHGGIWHDVIIRNASKRGLMIETKVDLQPRDYLEIRRASLTMVGRVVWADQHRCGIRTQDVVPVDALARPPGPETDGWFRDERRSALRTTHREVYDHSRAIASILQYGILALCIICAATLAAGVIWELLAPLFVRVGGILGN